MKLKSINPFNQAVISEFEELTDREIKAILSDSEKAFKSWKATTFHQRAEYMQQAGKLLLSEKEKFARTISLEMGKVIGESRAEVEKCAWVCRYYSEEAEKQLASRTMVSDARSSYIRFDPLGTILGIMPWNFPFWQVFRFLSPTLMAGNTALLKHASNVQGCAQHIEDIITRAGFPTGVFRNVCIGSGKVRPLIEDPVIKAVTLTGSEAAGASVAALAGAHIKKTVLELGGNNAFILFDDADLNTAIETGIKARMQNAGQSCIAAKRFLVHKKIADEFIERITEEVRKIKTGDPLQENTDMGPLSSIDQAMEVERQVEDSLIQGAGLQVGGKREAAFFSPTVLLDVTVEMPVFREEVFGPVLPVTLFGSDEEALALSNTSAFGLGVTLFTTDTERIERLAPHLNEGAVFVNELVKSDPRLPFGGIKHSGYGRELSEFGIREFVNVKTVYLK